MSFEAWVWVRRVAALVAGYAEYYGLLPAFGLEGPGWLRGVVVAMAVWLALTVAARAVWLVADRVAHAAGRYDPERRARREWQGEGGPFSRLMRRGAAADYGRGSSGGWETRLPSYGPGKAFLGRAPHSLRPVGIRTQKHMVTIGQTGSGKSSSVIIPNLVWHEGSVLCLDPKGELAAITAARRGKGGDGVIGLGQDVHVLDPFGTTGIRSAAYNVFDEIVNVAARDVEQPVNYAGKIADALVMGRSEKDPFWDNSAHTLIRGLVLHLFQGPPENRNLSALRRLLMEGDAEAWGRLSPEMREKITAVEALFDQMKAAPPGPYRDGIAGAGAMMLQMDLKTMSNVLSTAQEHTSFLDAPELKRACARSDFLLEDFKTKRLSVYLCLPLNMVATKEARWLRLFVMLFIDMMIRAAKPPDPPVLLMIDEFPNIGRIDELGKGGAAATLRSYGVRLWLAGQDIPGFKATYPEHWKTILGNAEAVQYLGVTEGETVEYLARRLGRHIVEGRMAMGGRDKPVMEERAMMEPEELALFLASDLGSQIVWRGSKKPMKLQATPYYEYLPPWQYSPDPRFSEPAKRARWRK